MDIDKEFPLKYYINLGARQDRRFAVQDEFEKHGLDVRRLAAVNGRWVRNARGFSSPGRYALGLTQRIAIRKARQQKAPAVLIFEDDVVFDGSLSEKLERLSLPDDCGIFYFGCLHMEPPERIGDGIVRVRRGFATHSFAVREPCYGRVLRSLSPKPGGGGGWLESKPSDVLLASLHKDIPTYAAYPNLAWQPEDHSDLTGFRYAHFSDDGRQLFQPEHVRHLEPPEEP